MQSDPLLGILSNIDTICQSAICDFSSETNDTLPAIHSIIERIRKGEQHKICNRIADLCTNIITCVSPGNAEFKSQIFSLVTSVTNMIKVYESLIAPDIERNTNSTSDNVALEQSENECRELKSKVLQLEKQTKMDSFLITELRAKALEFEVILQDNENLKFEITRFQDKLDKIEERSVQDLSSIKRAVAQSGQKIEELEEELSLAHKARHQSSISAQNAITDFRVARQNQDSAETKAKELELTLKDAQKTINDLEFKVAQVTDQLSSACLTHSDRDSKISQLEGQLRGLDKAEAAMISALQAKTFADNRISKLETDLLTMSRARDSLHSALSAKDSDFKRLTLSKEMVAREMMVLRAEVMTLHHSLGECEARLKETTMTMHAQHNQIVMCALQQMESTTREQAAQAETAHAHVEIAAMQEALLRAQAEHERIMGLLLTAQERLVAATNEHDTFNSSGGDSPTPTPIVSALFSRVSSIHANSSLSNSSTASQGGGGGSGRSATPPRTSLFNMPKRAISLLEDRVASAVGSRESETSSPLPSDGVFNNNSNRGSALDSQQQQTALIDELRRDLREATLARHHADMTVMTLKTELSSTRELLDEYQSRAESKRDYQELMRLRLQFRALEADLLSSTVRCQQLEQERNAILLQTDNINTIHDDSVENDECSLTNDNHVDVAVEALIESEQQQTIQSTHDLVEESNLVTDVVVSVESTQSISNHLSSMEGVECTDEVLDDRKQAVLSVQMNEPDYNHEVTTTTSSEQRAVGDVGDDSIQPESEMPPLVIPSKTAHRVVDCHVSEALSASAMDGDTAGLLEAVSSVDVELVEQDSISVMSTRRFVVNGDHPIVCLDIDERHIQLGVWSEHTKSLELVFSCPSYVAQVRPDVDRDLVLSLLERAGGEEHSELDPSLCEFFRETGMMVGLEAQHCLTSHHHTRDEQRKDEDSNIDDSSTSTLVDHFEKIPLLTIEGRLANPLALCYVILHCVLKGLGLEELGDLQLLCRHPGTFSVEDRDTLTHVLFDDLGVGKACLVSEARLIAESCISANSSDANDSMLIIDIGETTTVLVPISSGKVLEDAVVRCEIGERHISEYLGSLLASQLAELMTNPVIGEWLSENLSSVSRDALAHFRLSRLPSCVFTFSVPHRSGSGCTEARLSIDSQKHNCSALFFTPSLVTSCAAQSSIMTLIALSMGVVGDSTQRASIYSNIMVTGRTTLLTDLSARIQSRLQSSNSLSGGNTLSQSYRVVLFDDESGTNSTWKGAEISLSREVALERGVSSEEVLLASDFEN